MGSDGAACLALPLGNEGVLIQSGVSRAYHSNGCGRSGTIEVARLISDKQKRRTKKRTKTAKSLVVTVARSAKHQTD